MSFSQAGACIEMIPDFSACDASISHKRKRMGKRARTAKTKKKSSKGLKWIKMIYKAIRLWKNGNRTKRRVESQKGEVGDHAKAKLGRRLVAAVHIAWEMTVLLPASLAVPGVIDNETAMHYRYGGDGGTGRVTLICS